MRTMRRVMLLAMIGVVSCKKDLKQKSTHYAFGTSVIKSEIDPLDQHDVDDGVDTYIIPITTLKGQIAQRYTPNSIEDNEKPAEVHINSIYHFKAGIQAVRTSMLDSIENESNNLIDSVLLVDSEGDVLATQKKANYSITFPSNALTINETENHLNDISHIEVQFYYKEEEVTSSVFRYQIALDYSVNFEE